MLKKSRSTSTIVPRGAPTGASRTSWPPSIATSWPASASCSRVRRVKRDTEAMEGRASPRKPREEMFERSLASKSLLVACLESASLASSADMPMPSSATRMRSFPLPSIAMAIDREPASSEFSTSSFTTEAGRSTTSPAAIWFASASGMRRIRPIRTTSALAGNDLRKVGDLGDEALEPLQQRETVLAKLSILGHHQHFVEESIHRPSKRRKLLERFPVTRLRDELFRPRAELLDLLEELLLVLLEEEAGVHFPGLLPGENVPHALERERQCLEIVRAPEQGERLEPIRELGDGPVETRRGEDRVQLVVPIRSREQEPQPLGEKLHQRGLGLSFVSREPGLLLANDAERFAEELGGRGVDGKGEPLSALGEEAHRAQGRAPQGERIARAGGNGPGEEHRRETIDFVRERHHAALAVRGKAVVLAEPRRLVVGVYGLPDGLGLPRDPGPPPPPAGGQTALRGLRPPPNRRFPGPTPRGDPGGEGLDPLALEPVASELFLEQDALQGRRPFPKGNLQVLAPEKLLIP